MTELAGNSNWPKISYRAALAAVVIFFVAITTDVTIARWVHAVKPAALTGTFLRSLFWWLGHAASTALIAVIIAIWHRRHWRAALLICASALAAGLELTVVKWAVGRTRPFKGVPAFEFHPFQGGLKELVFGYKNATFPSGHACLAFAVATSLAYLSPRRWRWLFYLMASLVALFRVLEGAHYPSDVVGGAVLGIIAAKLVLKGCANSRLLPAEPAAATASDHEHQREMTYVQNSAFSLETRK